MPNENAQKREAPISYRPPKHRADEIRAFAAKSGMSMNAFITLCITAYMDGRRSPNSSRSSVRTKLLAVLLASVAKLRDHLHDIALVLGPESRAALLIEAAFAEIDVIRGALMKLMGRKP